MSKNAIAYIRVSTPSQAKSGIGLAGQQVKIRKYAELAGYDIRKCFRDVQTAMGENSVNNRKGLRDAILTAVNMKAPIIVSELDRLSRNTSALEKIVRKKGITIISADDGSLLDAVIIQSRGAKAQFQGEQISERTKAALQRKKEQGVILGNPTNLPEAQRLGAASNKRKAADRAEELCDVVKSIRGKGAKTSGEIADALNQRGRLAPRGQPWNSDNIRRLLRRIDKVQEERSKEFYESDPSHGSF
jgi:DNA invertase Pin-like site-specific DNA recombinase